MVARYLGVVEAASSSLVTQTSRSGMNRAFIPLLLFLQRKNMKLCPKAAPAPMAQRGGAGFPEARMRALVVPGCGRKFKSCHSDQTQKSPASLALTGFLLYAYKSRHALRNDTFSASTQMGVDVQGGFNVAVTEIFLHFFRLHAAVVQNACRAVPLRYNYDKPEKPRRIKGFEVFSLIFSSFSKPKNHTEISRIAGGVSLTTNE